MHIVDLLHEAVFSSTGLPIGIFHANTVKDTAE